MSRVIHSLPINRVEGDLEIRVEMQEDRVCDAWSVGTMYRGFENIMRGRGALDGLVITPRVCGICSTAHLCAAAHALDDLFEINVPDNGLRVRNITLGAEHLQNDVRQAVLLFMCDFTNPAYEHTPLFSEAIRRYTPLKGQSTVQTIVETLKLIDIISILGGQWPHSSFMVPGGVVSTPSNSEYVQCRGLLNRFQQWYEKQILGCPLERWNAVESKADMETWLDENESHQNSDLGFFIRFSKTIGLNAIGGGWGNFISYGAMALPRDTSIRGIHNKHRLLPAGFSTPSLRARINQKKITEDIAYSWLSGSDTPLHPAIGVTVPYATGDEGENYSWAKAPRYDGKPAETGPLAELIIARHPLTTDLLQKGTPSAFLRQLARIIRPAILLPALGTWIDELLQKKAPLYQNGPQKSEGEGIGMVEAPRGALGHWIRIKNNRIDSYQIIPPTTWNASPRDVGKVRGPMEEALVGTQVKDLKNPIELGHIVRSFDPCLVCTVHAVDPGQPPLTVSL